MQSGFKDGRTLVAAMAAMFVLKDVIPVPLPNTPAKTQPTPSIVIPSHEQQDTDGLMVRLRVGPPL